MLKCEVIKDLLPLYLDEVCSNESRELVEEHLKHCESCRQEAESMKQTYAIEEDFVQDNMKDGMLLQKGKKHLEQKVKMDYLEKAAFIDIFVNAFISIGLAIATGIDESFMYPVGTAVIFCLCAVPVMAIIWEIVFIVKNRRGKDTPVSQMIAMSSILLKVGCFVMMLISGIAVCVDLVFR